MAGYQGLGRITNPATYAVCKQLFDLNAALQRRIAVLEAQQAALTTHSVTLDAAIETQTTRVTAVEGDAGPVAHTWTPYAVVFVDSGGQILTEDPENFSWDPSLRQLLIRAGSHAAPPPDHALHVGGIVHISVNVAGETALELDDLTHIDWGGPTSGESYITGKLGDSLRFGVNGAEGMRLTTTGLGIGIDAPTTPLHLYTSTAPTQITVDADGQNAGAAFFAYGATRFPFLSGRQTSGTYAAPTGTAVDAILMRFGGGGHNGAAFVGANRAAFEFNAAETWGAAANGTYLRGLTTLIGATTLTERWRITDRGNMTLGNNPGQPSTGTQAFVMADGTAPTGMATDTAGIYADDVAGTVELFGIDEAGNAPQLTPHNFDLFAPDPAEAYPWSYYARNAYLGVEIGVDLARLVRAVETLTGSVLLHSRLLPPERQRDWRQDQSSQLGRAMAERERWEARKDAFVPSAEIPFFDDPPPPRPRVKAPPDWLATRLLVRGADLDLTTLEAALADWTAARPDRRQAAPSSGAPR